MDKYQEGESNPSTASLSLVDLTVLAVRLLCMVVIL